MSALLRSLRIHQWVKNGLILVPALAAHLAPGLQAVTALVVALMSYCLLSSAVYLTNDVLDAPYDRVHPIKRERPVAAGLLTPGSAVAAALVLAAVSLVMALGLPRPFFLAWATYLLLATAYSMGLKRRVVLDVLILAGLYTVRVVAGATAVDVPLSRWFLAFSVFLFTSLALLKRAVEAFEARNRAQGELSGRGWQSEDLPVLTATGLACAVAAALVYCLYITGPDVLDLYRRPDLLWAGLPALLYWVARMWVLALRGEIHDDPLVFALRDRASYAVVLVFGFSVWLAS